MNNVEEERRYKAKQLRYKRGQVLGLSLYDIESDISDMQYKLSDWELYDREKCSRVFDDDSEEMNEFELTVSELSARCDHLYESLEELQNWLTSETFDDIIVAFFNRSCNSVILGYDTEENDYFHISPYDQRCSAEESQKRLERLTKKELLNDTAAVISLVWDYLKLKQKYDYVDAELSILQEEWNATKQLIGDICELYEDVMRENTAAIRKFDYTVSMLPERAWVE